MTSRLCAFFKRFRVFSRTFPKQMFAPSWFCVIAHCVCVFDLRFFRPPNCHAPFSFGPLADGQTKCMGEREGGAPPPHTKTSVPSSCWRLGGRGAPPLTHKTSVPSSCWWWGGLPHPLTSPISSLTHPLAGGEGGGGGLDTIGFCSVCVNCFIHVSRVWSLLN